MQGTSAADALAALKEFQREDFEGIFTAMDGLPGGCRPPDAGLAACGLQLVCWAGLLPAMHGQPGAVHCALVPTGLVPDARLLGRMTSLAPRHALIICPLLRFFSLQ